MDSPVTPPPRLPERYRLWPDASRALLGRGGAGEVWRAQDQGLGVLVALKVMRAEGARMRSRLGREAALAAQIVHPHVVAIHDVGETPDGNPFVAFALASDGSLLELSGSPPPWPELVEMLAELLSALGALHARGLLHLDVKLSNLLLHRVRPRRRVLWLADLGIARAFQGEPDEEQTVLGTVSYMASERLTGQRHLWRPATDLFSVGAIAWRLVTGHLPFAARDPVAALSSRRRMPDRLDLRPGYVAPARLDEVLLPFLAYDARGRYDTAADALRALRALPPVDAQGVEADPNPAGRPAIVRPGVIPWFRPAPRPMPPRRPRPHAPRRAPQALSLLAHREIPLVGRDEDLDLLWAEARAVSIERRPRVVHLTGPRGIGRTRLVIELTRALEQEGHAEGVLLEYAVRDRGALGLQGAWRRLAPPELDPGAHTEYVAGWLARDRATTRDAAHEAAAALTRWLLPRPEDPPGDPSAGRARLAEHLAARAWRGLSWLWLEDVHLADEDDDVWPLLEQVLERRVPALVLVTTREDVATPRLQAILDRFQAPACTLRLGPLPGPDAAALVQAHLPLEEDLSTALVRHTGGNPRYIHDLLLHWVRTGALVPRQGDGPEPTWELCATAPPLPRDRMSFARELLAAALAEDPELLPALTAVALCGRGTPERVIARVAADALDRALVAGLVTLERGSPVLTPPELPAAVRAWPRPLGMDADLHERLAGSWAQEGRDPAVLERVGHHYAEAGRYDLALEPLDQALAALGRSRSVFEAQRLARRTLEVAERAPGGAAHPARARAAMALAEAHWLRGEHAEARALDDRLCTFPLPAVETVRAACLYAAHAPREETPNALARLARVSALLTQVPSSVQAEYYCARGRCRDRLLDVEGALDDLGRALRLGPDALTEIVARYYRAELLSTRDAYESQREAMRAATLAREAGLLRWEAMAWSVIGEQYVASGRADEAVSTMRAAIARLRAHGEYLFAGRLTNNLGEVLRRAGRDEEARAVYRAAFEDPALRVGDIPLLARANLAIMDAVDGDGPAVLAHAEALGPCEDDPTVGAVVALLEPLGRLLCGQPADPPELDAVVRAVRLGPDGVFLDLALASVLAARGRPVEARIIERAAWNATERFGIDQAVAEVMLARFLGRLGVSR